MVGALEGKPWKALPRFQRLKEPHEWVPFFLRLASLFNLCFSPIQFISLYSHTLLIMQYKILATLFLATTALAAPAPADSTATASSTDTTDSDDSLDLADVPSSIMSVLATAIPASWYDDLMDPASRSAIVSEAAAGTYPAWYNALPSSVKAWATSNFDDQIAGATATADSTATQTETADSTAVETGSSTAASQTSNAAETSSNAAETSSNAAETTSASTTSSGSSSDSSSSSTSSSPSSTHSTGGAPAPTGGIAMSVAGAAGVLALALAL